MKEVHPLISVITAYRAIPALAHQHQLMMAMEVEAGQHFLRLLINFPLQCPIQATSKSTATAPPPAPFVMAALQPTCPKDANPVVALMHLTRLICVQEDKQD